MIKIFNMYFFFISHKCWERQESLIGVKYYYFFRNWSAATRCPLLGWVRPAVHLRAVRRPHQLLTYRAPGRPRAGLRVSASEPVAHPSVILLEGFWGSFFLFQLHLKKFLNTVIFFNFELQKMKFRVFCFKTQSENWVV